MTEFTEQTVNIIRNIPLGRVMTYGQIARLAGNPRGARQVVRVLSSMSEKHHLPWHRVVNRFGDIALKSENERSYQMQLLVDEGIICHDGNVDLKCYQVL